MKKVILTENGLNNIIERSLIEESFNDKVIMAKNYIEKMFGKGSFQDNNGNVVGVFVKMSNGAPTDKSLWKSDVLDDMEDKLNGIITDKEERKGFLAQVLQDWWNNYKGLKIGVLSNYGFLNKRKK